MKTKQKKITHRISASFLLLITLSTIFFVAPLVFNNESNSYNEAGINEESLKIPVNGNGIGEDSWWNVSYQWRQCINITNPGNYNLTDNYIGIQFNYTILRDNYNMDPDLYDVRIVEDDTVRNYYVKKDFPSNGLATIWFETNSTSATSDYDTYMYWGNSSINDRGPNHVSYDPSGSSWWSFEEGSGSYGSNVIDSLNFANATLWGTSSSYSPDYDTDSAIGSYSLNFDGSHDFVYINDELHFTNTNEIQQVTVSCWFKTLYTGGSYSSNWAFFDFDRSEYFNFYIDPRDGKIGFSSSAQGYSGQNDFYGNTTGLNDGNWHFASVVYDGTDKIIYVDGVEDNRWVNAMNGLGFGRTADRWGFFGDGSEASEVNGTRNNIYYSGNIDEIRYFEYAVAPDEIEWLANYYSVQTDLLPVTQRAASVTIIVEDIDGRRIPGAEVSLWDNLTHILEVESTIYTEYTSSDGTVSFTKVPFGFYNITVNYTLNSGLYEEIVFDGRMNPSDEVEFKGLSAETNVTVDLWTIDFEVEDWDGDPLNYGYVNVSAGTNEVLESLILDSAGKTTFRWLNRSSYNYTIYYDNSDYTIENPTQLNSSVVNRLGIMNYTESVITTLSKLNIRVMDETGTESVTGVSVKVQLNNTSIDVVELETDTTGYAYGDLTKDFGFWYKTEQVYNFTLWVIGQKQFFQVKISDKGTPVLTDYYNYTLDKASLLVFFLDGLNFTERIANFTDYGGDTEVIWGDNMSFWVLYETSNNSGLTWEGDWNRLGFTTTATWTIYTKTGQKILEQSMSQASGPTGNFTIMLNSSFLSAGDGSEFYFALITGYKPFWNDPIDQYFGITVSAKLAGLTLHNYTSMPDELSKNVGLDYEISEYYGNTVNIAARFYDSLTNGAIVPDTFTYEWDYGSGSLTSGPIAEYYYFSFDTSLATNVGKYRIDISVSRENHSMIEDFGMYINIISRPTTINGSAGLLYVSSNIFIDEEKTFTFEYKDVFTDSLVSDLDEKSFLMQQVDEQGDVIPGTTETGELTEIIGNRYVLDIDTESREVGEYSIIVTLNKLNYEHRIAIISLIINKKEIHIDWSDEIVDFKTSVGSGAPLRFSVTLTDPNNSSVPILSANVYVTFKGVNYYFNETGAGTYTLYIPKIADAFFLPATFTATLTIEKQDFETKLETITIVVNMHQTFGFPTFYLLMIIGAVVAVVASLTIYRTVQQARIPTFVKKARKMKKEIKGKKSISDSLLYPTKDEYLVKQFGERWEILGLSLKKTLGFEDKKKKKLPESSVEFQNLKGGGT
ncbi:MAG: LamG-like jellyroll fold domain-containing protein [Candidatus Thorarchaeota archaeon]